MFLPTSEPQGLRHSGQVAHLEGVTLPSMGPASAPGSVLPNPSQGFQTPRRSQAYGRGDVELHIPPPNYGAGPQGSRHHQSQDSTGGNAPGINLLQATPPGPPYSTVPTGSSLPGALQSGRPSASSINTAPTTIPTLPQNSGPPQSYTNPSRPSAPNHAHNYSRSSPASMDQPKYVPYINTPENNKLASTPNSKYSSSQTPLGDSSLSPLGLADIRSLGDADPLSASPYSAAVPTNSNYLAPWAVYAFDWCKWPVQNQGAGGAAGKMAIGSYVEDGHNFVSEP